MTELQPTLAQMSAPANPKQWAGAAVPPDFPIQASHTGSKHQATLGWVGDVVRWAGGGQHEPMKSILATIPILTPAHPHHPTAVAAHLLTCAGG